MPDVSYVPGALIAVAGEVCLALVEAAPGSAATTWIWRQVAQGAPPEAVLAGLLGTRFADVGGFALLAGPTGASGQRRLFCRGPVAATVAGGNVSARIDGAGLLTWREYAVAADAERIVLGEQPDDNVPRLPAATGVVLASCVVVDLTSAADRDTIAYDSPVTARAQDPEPPSLAAGSPGPASARSASPVRLIDAVQWGPGSGAAAAGPDGADDGELTVNRADLPAPAEVRQGARSATAPDRAAPTVPALICPAGHPNPPSEAVCRQCGERLPNDVVVVPRPVLGILRFSTGDVIRLDREAVMGRDPRANFTGADGGERPHVVKLPGADGDISRTHVRVTLDGWHVLVTDLKSTNGTLVTLPGRDPEQLRPDEPVPIRPGTVVTLADGIDFRYEVAE